MTRRIFCKILLVVVAILGLFVLSGVLSAQGNRDTAFQRVRTVQAEHTNRLMAIKGVEGTAIGLDRNDRPALKVFTAGPGVRGIPQELDGVPVQVVVTGKIYALVDPTARFPRPVPIGVSTGHPDITAGTIGCRVKDLAGNVYALSNNHVYANSNEASIDDDVIQPGTFDGGAATADTIGTLSDFEPIEFSRRARNEIDAAIALSSTLLLGSATPADGYGTPNSTIVGAVLGQQVQKFGRTTELTQGEITGVNATVNVGYAPGKTAKFVKQIIIEPGDFSAGGDSGSLIVTNDESCNPVGLLFAGSSSMTVANPIDLVLARFGVTVDGEEPTPNDPPIVSITSPADGSTFESGTSILFEGTASDTEDGDLTAALAWTSSIDDQIGTGGSFSTTLSDGTHTITAEATDSGGKTGSDSISITVGTPPSAVMHVASIDMSLSSRKAGRNTFAKALATVTIVDADGNAVEGATVYGTWSGATSDADSGMTDSAGEVTLASGDVKNAPGGTTFTFTVDNVTRSDWTYDPAANAETTDSITVP